MAKTKGAEHYHRWLNVTLSWAQLRDAMTELAHNTQGERDRRERERAHDSERAERERGDVTPYNPQGGIKSVSTD